MGVQGAASPMSAMSTQLHASMAELEQEKIELQKKHTQSIQELLEDTNQRLAKMESEYSVQMQATVSTTMPGVGGSCMGRQRSGDSLLKLSGSVPQLFTGTLRSHRTEI